MHKVRLLTPIALKRLDTCNSNAQITSVTNVRVMLHLPQELKVGNSFKSCYWCSSTSFLENGLQI